jgi:hypothetical protein
LVLKKSPGGSIFPYYYKNGELFGAHFGSFFDDEDRLAALMKAEADFFLDQNRSLPYWVDFYETRLTEQVLDEFCRFLSRLDRRITRLAIVGCSWRDRLRFRRATRKNGLSLAMPVRFFSDPEVAKTWLVSEATG